MIHITKTFCYNCVDGNVYRGITSPETTNAVRSIPMLPDVRKALETERKLQEKSGVGNHETIDGYSNFVFCTSTGSMISSPVVTQCLRSIIRGCNREEETKAKKEKRTPVLLPNISPHIFLHSFCTRLCENESNIKVVQSIMGHADITTTMDIYNEATEKKKKEAFDRLSDKIIIA